MACIYMVIARAVRLVLVSSLHAGHVNRMCPKEQSTVVACRTSRA